MIHTKMTALLHVNTYLGIIQLLVNALPRPALPKQHAVILIHEFMNNAALLAIVRP